MKHKPQLGRLSVSLAPSTESDNDSSSARSDRLGLLSGGDNSAASSFQDAPFSPPLSAQPAASGGASPLPCSSPQPSAAVIEEAVFSLANAGLVADADDCEFNDGLSSPLPTDSGFFNDPYAAAWLSLTHEEEAAYLNSADYAHFSSILQDGRLALHERDLTHPQRWKCLGFFLSRNPVLSLRFHGVDLQVAELVLMKNVMVATALTNAMRRRAGLPRSSGHKDNNSKPLWTGGWGLDIDSLERERRKQELSGTNKLRSIIFSDTQLGASVPSPDAASTATAPPAQQQPSRSSSPPTALQTTISLLLICELLESVSLWRNNLGDEHAAELGRELLLKHPSLKRLSLRWNVVTAKGARQLGAILRDIHQQQQQQQAQEVSSPGHPHAKGGERFEELDLCFNRIDEAGIEALRADMAAVPCRFLNDSSVAASSSVSASVAAATSSSASASSVMASMASTTASSSVSASSVSASGTVTTAASSTSTNGASSPASPTRTFLRPPFLLNLQRQHTTPYCWRPQPQRMIDDTHFTPFASSTFNIVQPRAVRPTA